MRKIQGNYEQAESYFEERLSLGRQLGRPLLICVALYEYGMLSVCRHKIDAASKAFHEMKAVIPEGSPSLLALAQFGLARVAQAQGKIQEAVTLGEESLTVLQAMEQRRTKEVREWLIAARREVMDFLGASGSQDSR